jgi:hypothetical protein
MKKNLLPKIAQRAVLVVASEGNGHPSRKLRE